MKKTWIGNYTDIGYKGEEQNFAFRIDAEIVKKMSFSGRFGKKNSIKKLSYSYQLKDL
jgi:hypothetical protein